MINRMGVVTFFLAFHAVALTGVKAMMMESKLFRTLQCNLDADLPNVECTPWSESFGTELAKVDEIVIPCGKCITMDVGGADDILSLAGGLNVIGKLVIADPVEIETPHVIVQGELVINSNKIWDGTQDIVITLTGTASKSFLPANSNASKCNGNPCTVGKKPFAIAGGKLLVDGMPKSEYETPTWLHIQDVKSSSGSGASIVPIEPYPGLVNLTECAPDGTFVKEDFSNPSEESPTAYDLESSLGTRFEFTEDSLKVSNRKETGQGPVIDMMDVMKCIKTGVRYQVNARVKAYREESGPDVIEESDCVKDKKGCLDIKFKWKPSGKWEHREYAYHEEHTYGWQYGEEMFISETIVFRDEMLESTNIYSIFSFEGALPGVAIEIYEFEFKLAAEEAYRSPSDVCPDIALPNGDAELDPLSTFPYKADAYYTNVVVAQDEDNLSNHFFRISGRGYSYHNSLRWNAAIGCITRNAVYRLKVDYRLHSCSDMPNPENHGFRVRLKVKRADSRDSWYEMAKCQDAEGDNGVWKTCDRMYTVPEDVVREGDLQYEIVFETATYIEYDVDNISIVQTTGPITTVTVDSSVEGKWGAGAEVLITSHTNQWNNEQVRRIERIEASDEEGFVDIVLNATIAAPTTMKDDSRYATEIAILSRNIKLQGASDDPDSLHGGHLIVLHTPGDGQDIVGLEVTNMGQAGNLGRYPLHFHMCGDVKGSRMAKNLIRGTKQRCTVVHGTDSLLVDNNVAYDTFGHCFMVEDGMERFNTFSNNLGARTKDAERIIPDLPSKFNGKETDNFAATFWITNPMNYYVNNVAAGGEGSGYWFELRHRPRGTMFKMYEGPEWSLRSMSLGSFKGNVAHSYLSAGIRTYPNGYVPSNVAVFEDSRVYRNDDSGMFIHNSRNITLKGFHFADNEQGVDVDRIDLFELRDSEIVGRSEDYKIKVLSQKAPNVCAGRPTYIRGVEMHTFRHDRNLLPTLQGKFKNVTFSGFNDTGCDSSAVFWADDEVRVGSWDYWTALEDSKVDGVSQGEIANFCRAVRVGITDSYIIDHDNAFGAGAGGPSTIMTYTETHNKLQAFVEPTLCQNHHENCYSYCENTCLRTVTIRVDPGLSDDHTLRICKKDDPQGRCEIFKNWYNHDTQDRFRIFSPALPPGSYTGEFLDKDEEVMWPHGVNITYEVDMCDGEGLSEGSVEFTAPAVDESQCVNLISNGDAEFSDNDPGRWVYERNMGIEIVQSAGIGGSNAFGDAKTETHDDGLTQHLDTRCLSLNRGRQYEVKAYVKLIDSNGKPVYCDPSVKHSWGCPRIMLHYGIYRREGERWRRDQEIEAGLTRARSVNDDGYQLVNGIVTISDKLADASNVRFFVERRFNNMEMFVDNVSMTLISESSCEANEELVPNGDFEGGTSAFWNDYDSEGLQVVSPGAGGSGFALKMKTGSAQNSIQTKCIEAGKRYIAQAKYRLLDSSGNPTTCDPQTHRPRCPEMSLKAYDENGNYIEYTGQIARALDSTTTTADGFSVLWGIFEPSQATGSAANVRLFFSYTGQNMILDNVSVKEIGNDLTTMGDADSVTRSAGGDDLIVNGDNEKGLVTFWSGSGVYQDKVVTTTGYGGSGIAARVTGRDRSWKGMWYSGERYMEHNKLTASSRWTISAQIRLFEQGTETGADCDISERIHTANRCPRLRVRFYDEGDPYTPVREEIIYSYTAEWNKDGWNEFKAHVEAPMAGDWSINKLGIFVSEVREKVDIAVDNLSMVPMS